MEGKLGCQPGLDGLRAIAVTAAVGFHYKWGLAGGWHGVNLFFVISGYLITRLLIDEHAANGRIRLGAFYRRRAARLLPALYVTVAVFIVVGWLIRPEHAAADLRGAIAGLLYVANLDRYFGWSDGAMFGHLWSLSLEEQFYALWPVAFVLLSRRRTRQQIGWIVGAMSGALFVQIAVRAGWWFNLNHLYNGIEGQGMAFLLAGCAWGALNVRGSWLRRAAPIGAAIGLLVAAATLDHRTPATYVAMPLLAAGMLILVSGALRGGPLERLLGCRPLRYVGQRSYGIYLIHAEVRILFDNALAPNGPLRFGLSTVALVVTLLLAAASYRWVEQPLRVRLSGPRPLGPTAERSSNVDTTPGQMVVS